MSAVGCDNHSVAHPNAGLHLAFGWQQIAVFFLILLLAAYYYLETPTDVIRSSPRKPSPVHEKTPSYENNYKNETTLECLPSNTPSGESCPSDYCPGSVKPDESRFAPYGEDWKDDGINLAIIRLLSVGNLKCHSRRGIRYHTPGRTPRGRGGRAHRAAPYSSSNGRSSRAETNGGGGGYGGGGWEGEGWNQRGNHDHHDDNNGNNPNPPPSSSSTIPQTGRTIECPVYHRASPEHRVNHECKDLCFRDREEAWNHGIIVHFWCAICRDAKSGKSSECFFDNLRNLRSHIFRNHFANICCEWCGKSFGLKNGFLRDSHVQQHLKDNDKATTKNELQDMWNQLCAARDVEYPEVHALTKSVLKATTSDSIKAVLYPGGVKIYDTADKTNEFHRLRNALPTSDPVNEASSSGDPPFGVGMSSNVPTSYLEFNSGSTAPNNMQLPHADMRDGWMVPRQTESFSQNQSSEVLFNQSYLLSNDDFPGIPGHVDSFQYLEQDTQHMPVSNVGTHGQSGSQLPPDSTIAPLFLSVPNIQSSVPRPPAEPRTNTSNSSPLGDVYRFGNEFEAILSQLDDLILHRAANTTESRTMLDHLESRLQSWQIQSRNTLGEGYQTTRLNQAPSDYYTSSTSPAESRQPGLPPSPAVPVPQMMVFPPPPTASPTPEIDAMSSFMESFGNNYLGEYDPSM